MGVEISALEMVYHSANTLKTKGVVEQYLDYEEW